MCNLAPGAIEPCQVWRETVQRARKAYVCDCCLGAIAVGETYKRIFTVSEGHGSTERECAACTAVMDVFKQHHPVWYTPSGMYELIAECLDEERRVGDNDEDVYTPIGAVWRDALAAMAARAAARKATSAR